MQEVLTGYVGQQALARHLDSDEAVVLGASLRAANLSDGIKLNRKLGMVDGASYGIDIKLDGATLETKDQGLLVPLHKNLPSKVSTFTYFPLTLYIVLHMATIASHMVANRLLLCQLSYLLRLSKLYPEY